MSHQCFLQLKYLKIEGRVYSFNKQKINKKKRVKGEEGDWTINGAINYL